MTTTGPHDATPEPPSEDELARARARGEFRLLYQPEFDVRRGSFAGVEALLRWRHPTRGLLGPADFVDRLATSGLLVPVGYWALAEVTRQGARWHDRGYRFPVALNVAASQARELDFVDEVARALHASALAPAALTLEFATATLEGLADATRTRLLALGVRLGVDDVEPGVTDVAALADLGVAVAKLRRGAVDDPARGAALTDALAPLVARGVRVVAAGVENPATAQRLEAEVGVAGSLEGQGFLYGGPQPAAAIDRLLEDFAIFSGEPL